MSKEVKNLIVGLDIGTSKIVSIVAELTPEGRLEILGLGTHQESRGLKKGVVVNIEATVNAISRVIQEVELMADCKVKEVYTGIAGSHIKSFNSNGMVAIKDKEVSPMDVDRVIETARAMPIPSDQQILHILTQEFIVDGQDGVREPIGMSGVRLEVRTHIVTGAVSAAQNIVKCVRRCGLEVIDLVLQPLASSYAVLTEDEKELGVCLVDIGGGTTDIAVFQNGSIVHTAVIALGGNNLTNDIAMGLRTPMEQAERIKQKHGCALTSMVDKQEMIEVPSVGGRDPRVMGRQILSEILEPRVEEIFQLVHHEIERNGFSELLASGVVITGGSTLLPGMPELAEEIMGVPVRRGVPRGIGGLVDVVKSPVYATGVGLVVYGAKNLDRRMFRIREGENVFKKVKRRMGEWLQEVF